MPATPNESDLSINERLRRRGLRVGPRSGVSSNKFDIVDARGLVVFSGDAADTGAWLDAAPYTPPPHVRSPKCRACNGDGFRGGDESDGDGRMRDAGDVKCADCRGTGYADPADQNDALGIEPVSPAESARLARSDAAYDAATN